MGKARELELWVERTVHAKVQTMEGLIYHAKKFVNNGKPLILVYVKQRMTEPYVYFKISN